MAEQLNIDLPPEPNRTIVLNSPVMQPPDGVIPNLSSPHHRGDIAIAVTTTFLVLTSFAVSVRCYSQFITGRLLSLPNVLGLLSFGAYCGLVGTTYRLAMLRTFWNHQWNFSFLQISHVLFQLYLQPIFYCLFTVLIKPAILYEWKRIFVPYGVQNRFSRTCNALIIISVIFYIAYFIALQFHCRPYSKIWRRWVPGECYTRGSLDIPSAVFNLVLDVFIFILPQRTIWGLQATRKRRAGIAIVFSVGLLAVGCATGLVYTISRLDYEADFIFDQGPAVLWFLAESTCVLLVFCVPFFPKAFHDTWVLTMFEYPLSKVQDIKRNAQKQPSMAGGNSPQWHENAVPTEFHGPVNELSTTICDRQGRFDQNRILRTTEISVEINSNAMFLSMDNEVGNKGEHENSGPWDGIKPYKNYHS